MCAQLHNPKSVLKHFYSHVCVCKECSAKGHDVNMLGDVQAIFHIDRILMNKPTLANAVGSGCEEVKCSCVTTYVYWTNRYCLGCHQVQQTMQTYPTNTA